jgi:hypothetical protein
MMPPTLGQVLLGTEGLALLRLAATDDAAARDARVAEIHSLVTRYDAELSAPLVVRCRQKIPSGQAPSAVTMRLLEPE